MLALNRKLVRDLWRLRGQVLAIALVIASGVAVLVMSLSSTEALSDTAAAYYERYHFADVFAGVKRAPSKLADRIAAIPGVQLAETRIVKLATLDVAGFEEPVIGQLISLPEATAPLLNRLALRAGRWIDPTRPDEVIVSEPFAEAHGLLPGDQFKAVMNGHKRTLTIAGLALSPEYIYAIGPGMLLPDDDHFGVIWMGRDALEAAYDLDGAFNHVSISLLRGAPTETVIQQVDNLLDRFGGVGAYERADQISNWFVMNEIEQLKSMASILPPVFLAVAAFLTNMVLARLIATERAEIGLMKAFGYSNLEVGWHYAKLVLAMAAIGIAIGWAAGAWLGRVNTEVYAELYRFPVLYFRPSPSVFLVAGAISLGAALLGSLTAVRRAVALPPAEAMRPPAPPLYRRSAISRTRLFQALDQPSRIILRQIFRWPFRSLVTATSVGMAIGVLITSLQWFDSIDHLVETYFIDTQRQDLTVGLIEAQSPTVLNEFEHMPGVLAAEPGRSVTVKFRAGTRTHRGAIHSVLRDARLNLVYDVAGRIVTVPPDGLVLSTVLAEKLAVRPGDFIEVAVLEGRRPVRRLPVVGLFETYIGMPAYMDPAALHRLMSESPRVEQVHLLIDSARQDALFRALKDLPDVSSVVLRQAAIDTFYETIGETLLIYVSFFVTFACTIVFGVVYNAARIALSERGRELATLRVLGFSRTEISYILLGELALLTLVALPLGCAVGYFLSWVFAASFATELFRIAFVIEPSTYGMALLIGLSAALLSAAFVRRRVDHLDLIAVLKTRE